MYNDGASEAALYLVPNSEGTGKRLVRRPHPPPTTAPLPDDFDAITITRGGTTILDPADSQLDIDYDDMTIERGFGNDRPMPPPRRRAGSPTRSLVAGSVGLGRGQAPQGFSKERAMSVTGAAADRSRVAALGGGPGRKSLGQESPGRGKGPPAGRNELVQKKVLEDGPDRTISVWREGVAKSVTELDEGDGDASRSEADSHAGRRRVSGDSRRRVEGNTLGLTTGSVKGKERAGRRSVDLTESPRSPQQQSFSGASSPPQTNASRISPPQLASPRKLTRPRPDSPPRKAANTMSSSELSISQSKATATSPLETVLSSCQPSLIHIAPILEELGVRKNEHLRALARMSDETRDREVKEEALKKGITVVEWAIFLDKLQSL